MAAVTHGIVSKSLADQLRDYLKFRHFFIHGYGFMLEPELLMPLAEKAKHVFDQFFEEIELYISKPKPEMKDNPDRE